MVKDATASWAELVLGSDEQATRADGDPIPDAEDGANLLSAGFADGQPNHVYPSTNG